jgi:putative ABC transport system permease protein
MLVGIAVTFAVLAFIAWALILGVRGVRGRLRGSLRYGLANVGRRAGTAVAQISALGLGLMALLLLTFVRTDLLDRWQVSLAENAPNRFIINVQQDQLPAVRTFMAQQGLQPPTMYPMVRARLQAVNGKRLTRTSYPDDPEMQRRAEREFNLSFANTLRDDNRVDRGPLLERHRAEVARVVGREEVRRLLRLEARRSRRLRHHRTILHRHHHQPARRELGQLPPQFLRDRLAGCAGGLPASWITAVNVPASKPRFTADVVAAFPNLTVIDIDEVLAQVRSTADKVSKVVQVVFWFSLAAGVLVLLAAISASQDERLLEGGVMRVLGGSRRQLRLAQASEFAAIGLLSGLVAAIAASVLAGVVATRVFDLPWTPNWTLAAVGGAIGMLAALATGLFATRRILDAPPSVTLRELQN